MSGETADHEHYDLAEMLGSSDLSARRRRAVHDAIVGSMIEGATPDRESVLRLIEFAAGRINFDEYKRQVSRARIWRHQGDIADLFDGPEDADWAADREAIDHELRQADADYAAGNTVGGEELRQRFGLP